jgi:radical SAM superfamily enzyme YgiQ (UPF0313 family)
MANVVLIEPPSQGLYSNLRSKGTFGGTKVSSILWPPTDLMAISGYLEKNSITTKIIDATALQLSPEQIKSIIKKEDPQLAIINTSTTTIHSDLSIAKVVKEVNNNIITAAIGVHVVALPEESLQLQPALDIVIYCEPEIPILNLIKDIIKKKIFKNQDLKNIKGIVYESNKKIFKNQEESPVKDLDILGFLSHDKIPLEKYKDPFMKKHPFTMTMATRGCINACTYCSIPLLNKTYRKRSINHVIEELKWIKELGIKELRFYENGLTYDKKWIIELCNQIIKEKIDLSWICNGTRVDRISREVIYKMKRAGCHTVCIGAESSSLNILKNCKKNITPDMVEKAVKMMKKLNLNVVCFFMIGLPGETKESIKETIKFAKRIKPSGVTFNIATPHPGTPFYDYLKKNNYLKSNNWKDYNPTGYPVFEYPHLSRKEIHKSMFKAYRSFYLRPGYILERLLKSKTPTEFINNYRNFISIIESYIFKKIH